MSNTITQKPVFAEDKLLAQALKESNASASKISFRALYGGTLQEIREFLAERAELSNEIEKVRQINGLMEQLAGAGSAILIVVKNGAAGAAPRPQGN